MTPLATMTRHGRTFRLAVRVLQPSLLRDVAELYAFCRTVDDLADQTTEHADARIKLLALRRAILDGEMAHPVAAGFLGVALRHQLDAAHAVHLIDTMIGDLGPVRMADAGALLRYAHGAAGTVGLLMCRMLGATDPRAAPHALDLGIAMQLTNIARDVAADAQSDRFYVPASWLPSARLGDPEHVYRAVIQVLDLAELYYRSGRKGLGYLPWRSRLAVGAAASVYREIGQTIRRTGPAFLNLPRCVVPQRTRLWLLAGSFPVSAISLRCARHDPYLHAAISRGPIGGSGLQEPAYSGTDAAMA
ncbi:phytoene/squalene synthase family protein [Lichenicola sp.]|uniref:phytoene/squalene synthase family protein n=1 Tax=Lichenicola sp. TaxID=2804529 RepID=UPI003B008F76